MLLGALLVCRKVYNSPNTDVSLKKIKHRQLNQYRYIELIMIDENISCEVARIVYQSYYRH